MFFLGRGGVWWEGLTLGWRVGGVFGVAHSSPRVTGVLFCPTEPLVVLHRSVRRVFLTVGLVLLDC